MKIHLLIFEYFYPKFSYESEIQIGILAGIVGENLKRAISQSLNFTFAQDRNDAGF
jgi:hypothetical protein